MLHNGDAVEVLRTLPDASVDAVITDPPYAEIDRDYGRLTEPQWHELMNAVVTETRRILKPTGSAVFILQPNSERVGRMRPWLWEFMAKWTREWNMVQDAWWWNHTALPTVHCHRDKGLMRPSVKPCVWLGSPNCYRNQGEVLWAESDGNRAKRLTGRCTDALEYRPSGYSARESRSRAAAAERNGVTPFNLIPVASGGSVNGNGHSACTPSELCDWWMRYISPPGGVVCDPFIGSGTVGLAALKYGRSIIGIERMPKYFAVAQARLDAAQRASTEQLAFA